MLACGVLAIDNQYCRCPKIKKVRSVNTSISAATLRDLRNELARAIAETSAPKVAALCVRLGLRESDGDDPWSGKYKYAERRLTDLSEDELVNCGHRLLKETEHFDLQECLARIEEKEAPAVAILTRRRLIDVFSRRRLATEMTNIAFLCTLWPKNKVVDPQAEVMDSITTYLGGKHTQQPAPTAAELLEKVGLLTCSRTQLFRFIEAVTGPEAQSEDFQGKLVEEIDQVLRKDGLMLSPGKLQAGSPTYVVKVLPAGSPADTAISAALEAFDPIRVHTRWLAALDRRASEPEGAITLARTLLEDVSKWLLDEAGRTWQEKDDLPILYRKLSKTLKLAPDDHTEEVFKKILGGCQSIVESLGTLRNKLGDAHSTGPKRARPKARHAELAVNLAGAMATFLVATWEERQKEPSGSAPDTTVKS